MKYFAALTLILTIICLLFFAGYSAVGEDCINTTQSIFLGFASIFAGATIAFATISVFKK